MANELNYAEIGTSSLVITANIYAQDGTQQGVARSCPETATAGYYSGDVGTLAPGVYNVVYFKGGSQVNVQALIWSGVKELTLLDFVGGPFLT